MIELETHRALLVAFDKVVVAEGAPDASGVYLDAAGRFGVAAGRRRYAVVLDAEGARAIAAGLDALARALDARGAAAAAEAGERLAQLVTEARH